MGGVRRLPADPASDVRLVDVREKDEAETDGIIDGVDYRHTGEVRRVDADALQELLDRGGIALIPALGYSPTGEVFNLSAADVAGAVAIALL